MKNRLAKILLSAAAVAALAVPVGAQARQGGDDPAGHVRHAAHTTTTTTQTATRTRTRTHHHGRHHARRADDSSTKRRGRGADDSTTARRGRGADDGPNHT
jgi:hypothetical protein